MTTVPGSSIDVQVLLFAQVRLAAGAGRVALALEAAAGPPTVADALGALVAVCPAVAPHLPSCRVALGVDYVTPEQPLGPGDELALIPPVQGG